MRVAIGCDHLGFGLKQKLMEAMREWGYEPVDVGCDSADSVDYPVYGEKVGRAVACGDCRLGIAICGTGAGISLAAGRVPGIRAVCCSDEYTAEFTRRHNDTNVLGIGARVLTYERACRVVRIFLSAEFEGGRHARRVAMLEGIR